MTNIKSYATVPRLDNGSSGCSRQQVHFTLSITTSLV